MYISLSCAVTVQPTYVKAFKCASVPQLPIWPCPVCADQCPLPVCRYDVNQKAAKDIDQAGGEYPAHGKYQSAIVIGTTDTAYAGKLGSSDIVISNAGNFNFAETVTWSFIDCPKLGSNPVQTSSDTGEHAYYRLSPSCQLCLATCVAHALCMKVVGYSLLDPYHWKACAVRMHCPDMHLWLLLVSYAMP